MTGRQMLAVAAAWLVLFAATAWAEVQPPVPPTGAAAPTTAATATTAPAAPAAPAGLAGPFRWVSSGPLIHPQRDDEHPLTAIKDPSIVRYNDRWHIYATSATDTGRWGMVYLSFPDWDDAADARQYYVDSNPNLRGYHCAPQVFYFEPQKLWYLVYQSQQPSYSTSPDLSDPRSWSAPKDFFDGTPRSVVQGWLDYWIICDDTHAYLFFTDDHGRFYRSRTTLAAFPEGFDEPVVVMRERRRQDLFEGGCTYRIKGTSQYLTLIEAAGPNWQRYYRGFLADRLDGPWRPLAIDWGSAFASIPQVRFEDGAEPWTRDISHGELLRDGYDQTMTIDPTRLALLYQGLEPQRAAGKPYGQLPWRLGLLRLDESPPAITGVRE